MDKADVNQYVIDKLRSRLLVNEGDSLIITKGDLIGNQGGTNSLKVVTVGK
jgi:pyruvate kinase